MSNIKIYIGKITLLAILILFYCKSYLAFPNVFIKQELLYSIFIAIFQYVGAGIIFAKMVGLNWSETLLWTQLPTLAAILFHYSIDYSSVLFSTKTVQFYFMYILVLPLISALSCFVYYKYS
jgi:hypothetical protein